VQKVTDGRGQEKTYISSKIRINLKPIKVRKPAVTRIGDPDNQTKITLNKYSGAMEIDLGTIN
jgi:hypothetical protein